MPNFFKHLKTYIVLGSTFSLFCIPSPVVAGTAMKANEDKSNQVWVGKSDGATSCNAKSGVSLDTMALELTKPGIHILKKKKIHDAQYRIAMCGIDKGTLNGFLILKKDLTKAKELGFKDMAQ